MSWTVDGQVLLPQRHDQIPQPLLLAGWPTLSGRREEEVAFGLGAELMDEDPEASRGVTEPSGRLSRRESVDKEGPQRLILSMGGVGGP